MPFLQTLCLIISVVTSGSYTSAASDHYLPSETKELRCDGLSNCAEENCRYTRSLIYQGGEKYYSGQQRLHNCGPLEMKVFYPPEKNKSFTYESQVMCYTFNSTNHMFHVLEVIIYKPQNCDSSSISCSTNCIKTHNTLTSVRYLAGIPKVCTPFLSFTSYDPVKLPELMCMTKEMCGDSKPCKYKGKLTSTKSSAIYSPSLQVKVSCGSLYAYLTCPDGAEDQFCSHDLNCYTYESNQFLKFPAMVVVLTKTGNLNFNRNIDVCMSQKEACPLSRRTASTSSFALGIPKYCIPWIEFDPKYDVFLPSKAKQLVCLDNPCTNRFCRLGSRLLSQKSGSFGGGVTIESDCKDFQATTTCPSNMDPSQLCSQTNKCYRYTKIDVSSFVELYFFEITVQYPVGARNSTEEVECKIKSKSCPVYEKTSSSITFVISSSSNINCYPWTMPGSGSEN